MTPIDEKECDARHEAEEKIRKEQAKLIRAEIKAGESRIRIWVLSIGLTLIGISAGAVISGVLREGTSREKIEQLEKYQEKMEQRQQKMQETLDRMRWGATHGGTGTWEP